jgi:hypothetical protein
MVELEGQEVQITPVPVIPESRDAQGGMSDVWNPGELLREAFIRHLRA